LGPHYEKGLSITRNRFGSILLEDRKMTFTRDAICQSRYETPVNANDFIQVIRGAIFCLAFILESSGASVDDVSSPYGASSVNLQPEYLNVGNPVRLKSDIKAFKKYDTESKAGTGDSVEAKKCTRLQGGQEG
jgi:hypothetical protein